MCNDVNTSGGEPPDHMIVWIDLNIGKGEDYKRLRAAFSSTANPNYFNPVPLINHDNEEIDRTVGFQQVNFEGVKFLLAAFTNVERCVEFLQENRNRKIFIITSGQIGRVLLPLIEQKCKDIFIDPVTKELCQSIYVFCHGIDRNIDWMRNYGDYLVSAFRFDAELLARMILDIANYFVMESKRLLALIPPDYSGAYKRLSWAHTLYDRYRTMEKDPLRTEFTEVNTLLEKVEKELKSLNDDN